MKISTILAEAEQALASHPIPNALQNARWILAYVLGVNQSFLLAHCNEEVGEPQAGEFFNLVRQRAAGKPLQYLLGTQEFMGREYMVTPDVLIPRPETELVVEEALARLSNKAPVIVDVGTGSGCIAVSLALAIPRAEIFAVDISRAALRVAQQNASRFGADNVRFVEGDLLAPLRELRMEGQCDLIVSNPPYVAENEIYQLQRDVRDWEPHVALIAGLGGTALYARLIPESAEMLKPDGWLVMEIGYNIDREVRKLFNQGWRVEPTRMDQSGIPRVIAAEKIPGLHGKDN